MDDENTRDTTGNRAGEFKGDGMADPVRGKPPQAAAEPSVRASNGVDEKTNTGTTGGSNASPGNPTPPPEPEARILEEVIIKPAPPEKKQDATAPQSLTPVNGTPTKKELWVDSLATPTPTTPEPAGVVPQKPEPTPLPPPPPKELSLPTPPEKAALREIPPELQKPTEPPLEMHPTSISSQPPRPISPQEPLPGNIDMGKERAEIFHILEESKLPERHTLPPSGPAPASKEPKMFDTTLGALVDTPKETVAEPAMRVPEQPPASKAPFSPDITPLRTLKNDLQEAIRTQKISFVRAVTLEQEKRKRRSTDALSEGAQSRSRRTLGTLFAAALLVVLGGAAFFGVSFIMQERLGPPASDTDFTILFAESSIALPLGNESPLDLKRLIAQARTRASGTLGSITRIVPTMIETDAEGAAIERPATLEEFLNALGANTPADLMRALGQEFFFGLHTVDENAPIFVIPVFSYERAFSGMLSWEDTVNVDLTPMFTPVPVQAAGPGGLPQKRRFEDVVMRNYDVRALKDDRGEIQLFYSFPTRSFLVIGESPYSFTEILNRLRAERKL